jgi:ribosome-associated translation inhibitor RaiA
MSSEIPTQFTHSVKLSETAKGLRIDVHVYTNDRNTAINEAISTYLETKLRCEKEKIQVAPFEVVK